MGPIRDPNCSTSLQIQQTFVYTDIHTCAVAHVWGLHNIKRNQILHNEEDLLELFVVKYKR